MWIPNLPACPASPVSSVRMDELLNSVSWMNSTLPSKEVVKPLPYQSRTTALWLIIRDPFHWKISIQFLKKFIKVTSEGLTEYKPVDCRAAWANCRPKWPANVQRSTGVPTTASLCPWTVFEWGSPHWLHQRRSSGCVWTLSHRQDIGAVCRGRNRHDFGC